MMTWFVCFWLAVVGAVLGSFFDCAAGRWAAGEDWVHGRSRCDSCGRTLRGRDLIPIFSYLISRGRCRQCGAKIPADCLIAELAGALALGLTAWRFGPTAETAQWAILAALLLALSLTDRAKQIIPDGLLLAAAANRVLWFFLLGQGRAALLAAGFALVLPLALLLLVLAGERFSGRELMGGGDIKLLFVLALYLRWEQMLLLLLAACLLGLLWAMVTRHRAGAALPFGPFLAAAAVGTVCLGEPVVRWYLGLF